ncbi:MAG: hypothetical protein IPF41_13115 [Flavobacteriales bacterium]|nr:hypothetical protein [Flavobacteriales bacterium]
MSARPVIGALAALLDMVACAQTPYPDLAIQDAAGTSGTHHYAVTQPIGSPASDAVPIEIAETADAEFVSAAQVRLTPGFHAGAFSGGGQFRARIDRGWARPPMVLIAPDPATSLVNGVMHVPKWEKVEIGLRLPQDTRMRWIGSSRITIALERTRWLPHPTWTRARPESVCRRFLAVADDPE